MTDREDTSGEQGARKRLLEIGARIARRAYLPSLERCRTISDARLEVARYDAYHGNLASELKQVWDELKPSIAEFSAVIISPLPEQSTAQTSDRLMLQTEAREEIVLRLPKEFKVGTKFKLLILQAI